MNILISAVGSTDPIRANNDGPLLHIARIKRPDKIYLIFSDEMQRKASVITTALKSIDNYTPMIEICERVIKSNEVFRFDTMFEIIYKIMRETINDEDNFILNLTSGTPQITAALFAINRIYNYNVEAIQVATPQNGSNEKREHSNDVPIELLIQTNNDNCENPINRIIEDKSEKVTAALIKRNLRELVENLDYQAAFNIMVGKNTKGLFSNNNRTRINKLLEDFVNMVKFQMPHPEFNSCGLSSAAIKALSFYCSLEIMRRRELYSDVLIKSKSLVEYVMEDYIHLTYPGLIVHRGDFPIINEMHEYSEKVYQYIEKEIEMENKNRNTTRQYNRSNYLNLISFKNIIDCLDPDNAITQFVKTTEGINSIRNRIAHGLVEIDKKAVQKKTILKLSQDIKALLMVVYKFEEHYFQFIDKKNDELLRLLN